MKVEISVPEVVSIFKEIQEQPEKFTDGHGAHPISWTAMVRTWSRRCDTQYHVNLEQQRLLSKYPNHAIGVFTGNDETATTVCHQSLGVDLKNVRIVGCDATREMRQWVENKQSIAVATIYNDLHTDETIETIIAAMSKRINPPLDPHLFPQKLETDMRNNHVVSKLWEDAA